mgnify:FL=1
MKICIIGAGSIGGMLAVRLAQSNAIVSVVARGAQLEAIQQNGLTLIEADGTRKTAQISASSDIGNFAEQDVIVLAVKAHQLSAASKGVTKALTKDGVIVTAQNGIPFWYFAGHNGPHLNHRLHSVDPDGSIAAELPVERIIGSVVYPAAEITFPGVIQHIEGLRFSLGELDGSVSERATQVSNAFRAAGFKSPVVRDIRSEIWTKLWGNLAFNPISALTRADLSAICTDEGTRSLAAAMMREAQEIAEKLGIEFKITLEKRIAGAAEVGAHKTSMLQDLEAGRALETEALIGAVAELGTLVSVPSPAINAVLACLRLLTKTTLPT